MKIGDFCKTNAATYSPKENWAEINYLDTGSITENHIAEIQRLVVGKDEVPSRARRKVQREDIVYSTVRPNQLHYGIITEPVPNMLVSTGFVVITVDRKIADPYYIYFYLTQKTIVEQLQAIGAQSTSAYPSIKPTDIEDIEIDLPTLQEQKAIGRLLWAMEEKAETNQKINDNLEQQAMALVGSILASGEPTVLGQLMSFENGFAFQSNTYQSAGTYRVITIKNVQDGRIDSTGAAYLSDIPTKMKPSCLLKPGDALLSLTGNVGRVGIVCEENLLLNQRVAKISAMNPAWLPFLYFMFRLPSTKTTLESIAKGTAQQNLSPVETLKLEIPFDKVLVDTQSGLLSRIYATMLNTSQENLRLAALRDALLPKLMSGEIDVSDVQI